MYVGDVVKLVGEWVGSDEVFNCVGFIGGEFYCVDLVENVGNGKMKVVLVKFGDVFG